MPSDSGLFDQVFDSLHSLGLVYRKIFTSFFTHVEASAGDPAIQSQTAFAVLHSLAQEGHSPSELAERHAMARSNMTSLLRQLEGRGLIEYRKSDVDGRSRVVTLTAAGGGELLAVKERIRRSFQGYLARLSVSEIKSLERTSREMERLLNKAVTSSP